MVDRCEIITTSPCTVVDLDGTYINGNTLKIYLMCGLRYLLFNRKFGDLTRLTAAVIKRRLKLSTHAEMKSTILSTLYHYDEVVRNFARRAIININPLVSNFIENRKKQGHKILLATAAPDFYVKAIWTGDYVASVFQPGQPIAECLGREKLHQVEKWMSENSCHLDTVVTDHKDDAPLFAANFQGANILVNPSQSTLRFFRKLQPAHFLLIEKLGDFSVSE